MENTSPGAGAGALAAMRVGVPNEAHLLAAIHLARGGVHVTMNFDDGVERAYALMAGAATLPATTPPVFHDALHRWRRVFPDRASPLRVVSRATELSAALRVRPLLVKLHGSLGEHADGVTLPLMPVTDEPDPGELGTDRTRAFAALAAEGFVLVTGFSASDLASRTALIDRLIPGQFRWVTPALGGDIRRQIAALDPTQPVRGRAVEALRDILSLDAPCWPAQQLPGPTFEERLRAWAAQVAPQVAAEAVAWALADAGHVDEAVEMLRRLVRSGAGARTRVRLADALARRRWPGDVASARRTYVRASAGRSRPDSAPPRRLRSYALARWLESLTSGHDAASPLLSTPLAVGALVAGARGARGAQARSSVRPIRSAAITHGAVLAQLERLLPDVLRRPALCVPAARVTAVAATSARRALDAWAHAASGRRRAMLERQAIELETMLAVLRRTLPPDDALPRLRRLSAVFAHVADVEGAADTAGTRALVAFAANDLEAARSALQESARLRPEASGVVTLAQRLVEAAVGRAPADPVPVRGRVRSRDRQRNDPLPAFVALLPKVDLHLHLEGAVQPGTLAALARRNGDLRVPWTARGVERWYQFASYRDFLNAHVLVCQQLRRPEDFVRVVTELGRGLAGDRVRYAEVAVSVNAHLRRGLPADELFDALEQGRRVVATRYGVRVAWCVTAGTRRGPAAAMDTVETVVAQRPTGVVSFGLAGLETASARTRFAPAFELAAAAGLRLVAHAGEVAGASSIWQALDALGAERIGHGIRCLEDPTLVARLRGAGIPLEVCVSSNVRTGVVR